MAGWKSQVGTYGCIPSKTMSQAADSVVKPKKRRSTTYRKKDQADICLNCKKKKCRGGPDCFKSRKKEQECTDDGLLSAT